MFKKILVGVCILTMILPVAGCGTAVSEDDIKSKAESVVSKVKEEITKIEDEVSNEVSSLEGMEEDIIIKLDGEVTEAFNELDTKAKSMIELVENEAFWLVSKAKDKLADGYTEIVTDIAAQRIMDNFTPGEVAFTLVKSTDDEYFTFVSDKPYDRIYATVNMQQEDAASSPKTIVLMADGNSEELLSVVKRGIASDTFNFTTDQQAEIIESYNSEVESLVLDDITISYKFGSERVVTFSVVE